MTKKADLTQDELIQIKTDIVRLEEQGKERERLINAGFKRVMRALKDNNIAMDTKVDNLKTQVETFQKAVPDIVKNSIKGWAQNGALGDLSVGAKRRLGEKLFSKRGFLFCFGIGSSVGTAIWHRETIAFHLGTFWDFLWLLF